MTGILLSNTSCYSDRCHPSGLCASYAALICQACVHKQLRNLGCLATSSLSDNNQAVVFCDVLQKSFPRRPDRKLLSEGNQLGTPVHRNFRMYRCLVTATNHSMRDLLSLRLLQLGIVALPLARSLCKIACAGGMIVSHSAAWALAKQNVPTHSRSPSAAVIDTRTLKTLNL